MSTTSWGSDPVDVDSIGMVLETSEPERVWNALRLGKRAAEEGYDVSAFLLGEGVEVEDIEDDSFDVQDALEAYVEAGGELQACGTCLDIRDSEGGEHCPVSTMDDLLEIVVSSDRLLTVG